MSRTGIVLLAALAMKTVIAQTEPSFEVVSARAVPEKDGIPLGFGSTPHISNGRLSWTTTAFWIVSYAHNAPAWRISGMKLEMSFYTINATMNPAATEDQVRGMLRAMLKERFGFAAHSESKEVSGYALVAGKNGPKIRAAGSEVAPMPPYLSTKPAEAFESRVFTSMEGPGTSAITGRRVPIQKLADELSSALSTFVDDRTGLTGNYYFGFTFQRPDFVPTGTIDLAPSVFDAIQESLGLKLEKSRRTVEFLLVDHLDKLPTDN
jgi:uncharacterized protein (TIGR03435 family)